MLTSGEKYQMKQSGSTFELLIRKSLPEDSGAYSCVCDDIKTTATVIITGETHCKCKKKYMSIIFQYFVILLVLTPQQSQ